MNNTIRRSISFLGAALLAAQLIGAVQADPIRNRRSSGAFEQAMPVTAAQKEIERLLTQISANAAIAGRHAENLESYTRVGVQMQYQTHAGELNRGKDAINAMGSDFRRLQELRPSALLWQQMVIDRLQPVLVGMAGHATDAIERLNEDRGKASLEYREAIGNLFADAGQVRTVVSVNLEYSQAREKLNRLDFSATEPAARVSPASDAAGLPSKASRSLEQKVRSELLKLPYYGVFDYLAFQIDGEHVRLNGHVSRPTLKSDAERAVRSLEGVATVSSHIEVLPLSPHDDGVRFAAYRAIYGHPNLARYSLNPNPPIRIIVSNGNLTLMGVVSSDMDRTVAHMQASRVPGAFSVTNHLQVGL